jgi:hypothetical protein
MDKQMSSEKFGLEIDALTKARIMAETESYSPKSRENYETAMEKSAALIDRVNAFLEKHNADAVSARGEDYLFGVITSAKDPEAPCGVTFYGSEKLAKKLASVFSGAGQRVISASDGKVIEPDVTTVPKQVQPPRSASRPKF